MTFVQTLLIATIPAVIAGLIAYLTFHLQLVKHRADNMSERAARHYLKSEKFKARKFTTLKRHLGGWDNDGHGLRKILVRAGAVRIYRKEATGEKTELWKLMERKNVLTVAQEEQALKPEAGGGV